MLIVTLASACGRKTDPKPPELLAPEALTDLGAQQTEAGVLLSWKRPDRYADGSRLIDLGGFRVERSEESGPFQVLAAPTVTDRDRIRQERRFRYVDASTTIGRQYRYRVYSFTVDGYVSQSSNEIDIVRHAVTPVPTATATLVPSPAVR